MYFIDLTMDDVTDRQIGRSQVDFFSTFASNNLGLIELSTVFFNLSHFEMAGEI